MDARLGADPDMRETRDGRPVSSVSVADDYRWQNDKGEWQSSTEWHRVVGYGHVAEKFAMLSKGESVYIEGRVHYNKWEDKDGNKRVTTEVIALRVARLEFIRTGGDDGPARTSSRRRRNDRDRKPNTHQPQDGGFDDSDIPF